MGYTKLFSSIIHSTIWREPDHVRIVWVTMLAMTDQYGVVECSVPGLADAARVNLQQCIEAIERLSAPDPYSRCPDYDGRRIEKIDGGFQILNYEYYRRKASEEEKREKNAEKQRRWRARQKALTATNSNQALPNITDHNHTLPPVTENNPSDQNRSEQIRSDHNNNKKKNRSIEVDKEYQEIAKRYLDIFNEVFSRRGMPISVIAPLVHKRIEQGIAPWQIYAAPILLFHSSVNRGLFERPNLNAILLRDGERDVRGPGGTKPGVNWIGDLLLGIDTIDMDRRTTEIAQHFEIFEDLKNKVRSYWVEETTGAVESLEQ